METMIRFWQIEYTYRVSLLPALRPMRDFDGSLDGAQPGLDLGDCFIADRVHIAPLAEGFLDAVPRELP